VSSSSGPPSPRTQLHPHRPCRLRCGPPCREPVYGDREFAVPRGYGGGQGELCVDPRTDRGSTLSFLPMTTRTWRRSDRLVNDDPGQVTPHARADNIGSLKRVQTRAGTIGLGPRGGADDRKATPGQRRRHAVIASTIIGF
jgi:hypothetical protein